MDSTGAGSRAGPGCGCDCDCVCGVLFIVSPKDKDTLSAKQNTKKDLARRRQSEHKFGRQEEEEQEKVVMKGGREVTGRLTNI